MKKQSDFGCFDTYGLPDGETGSYRLNLVGSRLYGRYAEVAVFVGLGFDDCGSAERYLCAGNSGSGACGVLNENNACNFREGTVRLGPARDRSEWPNRWQQENEEEQDGVLRGISSRISIMKRDFLQGLSVLFCVRCISRPHASSTSTGTRAFAVPIVVRRRSLDPVSYVWLSECAYALAEMGAGSSA